MPNRTQSRSSASTPSAQPPDPHTLLNHDLVAEPDAELPPVPQPAFEMVVLGSGGGPLETDCSG